MQKITRKFVITTAQASPDHIVTLDAEGTATISSKGPHKVAPTMIVPKRGDVEAFDVRGRRFYSGPEDAAVNLNLSLDGRPLTKLVFVTRDGTQVGREVPVLSIWTVDNAMILECMAMGWGVTFDELGHIRPQWDGEKYVATVCV